MAMIKCVECGSSISSLAKECPFCGCPSEHQAKVALEGKIEEDGNLILKNYGIWVRIYNNVKNGGWFEAKKDIAELTNIPRYDTNEIIDVFEKSDIFPIDYIIEKIPDQRIQPTTKPCSACGKTISVKAETCPHCGQPTGVHVCPRCGSTDVVYIDGVSKAASMMLFGIFSVNTVRNKYECWECHFKF